MSGMDFRVLSALRSSRKAGAGFILRRRTGAGNCWSRRVGDYKNYLIMHIYCIFHDEPCFSRSIGKSKAVSGVSISVTGRKTSYLMRGAGSIIGFFGHCASRPWRSWIWSNFRGEWLGKPFAPAAFGLWPEAELASVCLAAAPMDRAKPSTMPGSAIGELGSSVCFRRLPLEGELQHVEIS